MANLLRIVIKPLLKSQIRLYVFFGILMGSYQLILFIKYQELKMFGFGIIKGTMIGIGIGLMTGLALKEMCKKKKTTSSDNVDKNNEKSDT